LTVEVGFQIGMGWMGEYVHVNWRLISTESSNCLCHFFFL